MLKSINLGFIGAGQMAKAMGFPLIKNGYIKADQIITSCPDPHLLKEWKAMGCQTSLENSDVLNASDTIIWAVKPQIFPNAISSSKTHKASTSHFHISIMAGITLSTIQTSLASIYSKPSKIRAARVMPNIGMKVSSGCSVYSLGEYGGEDDKRILTEILSSSGIVAEVGENQINAYCGLFGSGIGFMFLILESMSDGGVCMGLPRDLSLKFAAQTMKGAAELVLEPNSIHPAAFKDSVCSPGGTTIHGVAELEKFGLRNGIISAIVAATKRGEDFGK